MSQIIDALSHVLRHRMGEVDREIIACNNQRELYHLWRIRRRLSRLWRALIGGSPANPGPGK